MNMEEELQEVEITKDSLKATLDGIIKITADSLVRSEELGISFNFGELKPVFEKTLTLFRSLNEVNLDNIPKVILKNLLAHAEQYLSKLNKVFSFTPVKEANPAQTREKLIQHFVTIYSTLFNAISPIIAYSYTKRADFEEMSGKARNLINEIEKGKIKQNEQAEQFLSEIKETSEQVRNAAAEIGVAQHAVHFKEQADEHKNNTKKWLIATFFSALCTLAWGVYLAKFYATNITELNNIQSIQFGIAKLVIFSVLYTATLWIGKIYKSQWHNYIVNKHRQNALSSFETFVEATSDEQTKNAVLLQATNSIFSPQNSGFISGAEQSTSSQILEIIRGVMDTSKPEQ